MSGAADQREAIASALNGLERHRWLTPPHLFSTLGYAIGPPSPDCHIASNSAINLIPTAD